MRAAHIALAAVAAANIACSRNAGPQPGETAPGADRTAKTAALETAANVLQTTAPVDAIAIYLDGFHVAKADAAMQMEAHHFCNQVNEDFMQCVLFDGNTAGARLMGIEYIISAATYATLPPAEKAFWHPHNYEILSGELRMPGVPDVAEKAALKDKINSYGKTWHTWKTGMHDGHDDRLPLGPPTLQWSFNHDGEIAAGMIDDRDKRTGLNTTDARRQRADLAAAAAPQGGVDALAGSFPGTQTAIAGVKDNGDAAARPVPTFGFTSAAPRATGR